ncbi:MAG TPA: DNRLRE domain-containing protein [Thermodesulfobacteriota bacterium]
MQAKGGWIAAMVGAVTIGLLAGGCGTADEGGGGSASFGSVAELDGTVREDGAVDTSGQPIVGGAGGSVHRAFFSFDLSSLPAGATVRAATLSLYQGATVGNPFGPGPGSSQMGDVVVDLVDFGATEAGVEFSNATVRPNVGTLSTSHAVGWRQLSVTEAVQDAVTSGRRYVQFRLRFSRDDTYGSLDDYAWFVDAACLGCSSGNPVPRLDVEYTADQAGPG